MQWLRIQMDKSRTYKNRYLWVKRDDDDDDDDEVHPVWHDGLHVLVQGPIG